MFDYLTFKFVFILFNLIFCSDLMVPAGELALQAVNELFYLFIFYFHLH